MIGWLIRHLGQENDMVRWISGVILALMSLVSIDAFAGCSEDTEVDSAVIEVLPESDCLVLDVVGNECVGGADLVVTNNCPEVFIVDEVGYSLSILSGEEGNIRMPLNDGEDMTHVVNGSLGAQDISISVTYTGRVTNIYEGCTAAGGAPSSLLALLALFGLRRRRRRS